MLVLLYSTPEFYLLPLFIILVVFLLKWFHAVMKKTAGKNPPPSPLKLPIIGNLHQLGLSPHRSLQALAKKHGPLMLLHLGSVPSVIASSADAAQEIMKTYDLHFLNRPSTTITRKLLYNFKDITFSPYGEYRRQVKSIAVIHLLSNKMVQSFSHVREEETASLIESMTSSSPVNLSDLFVSLANDVICRVAFGRTYGGKKFKGLIEEFVELLGVFRAGNFIPWLSWLDYVTGLNTRVEKVAKEFDDFLENVLEEHMNCDETNEAAEGRAFVDIMLEFQRENTLGFPIERDTIKALILFVLTFWFITCKDMFVAGTDTTFTTLEWTLTELLRHPNVMKRLQDEVLDIGQGKSKITEDDLENMKYLKAVIKESFRIHPALPLLIPRETTQEAKILGYNIAVGTQVFINAWAIGRDPSIWKDPEEFKPERFLDSSIDYKGAHFELIPFGAGRRGCPGISFGINVIELAIANIVYKFDLKLAGGGMVEDLDMSESAGIVVHRKFPLMVVATPC